MILYIQTPSIPRSGLHNISIKNIVEYLDNCKHFSQIKWFVNLDAIKSTISSNHKWESYDITKNNFEKIQSTLSKTSLDINVSHNPCFYLAFRHLTLSVLNDVKQSNLSNSDYCVLWLEDDWAFKNISSFSKNLEAFISEPQYKLYTLHKNKINMGGNADIIKGNLFDKFNNVNLDIDNKRDPENIRKGDVWVPHIFKQPLNLLREINNNFHHPLRKSYPEILSSWDFEGDTGDNWRANLSIAKNWSYADKPGIDASRSFTYK